MADSELFVVDADSHVLEPPDLWETYLEDRYKARAIQIVPGPGGTEQLVADGEVLLPMGLAGLGGVEREAMSVFEDPTLGYRDGAPLASMDTEARIRLLDDWGVDAGIVFPTIGILWDKPDDPELAMAWARAYNRWQWDFASPHLDRLVPIAQIPLYDVDLALAELRRCLRLGFKGIFVAPEPVCGKRPSHPDFDPLWRELEDAGLPLCLHVIVRFTRPVGGFGQWFDGAAGERNWVFGFGLGGTFQLIPAISALVCDGLFDRFPRLKALVVESGAGWVGYIMDRLDEKYERFGSTSMKEKPSEYFRRNVWVVFDPDERSIDSQCDLLGEGHLLWGSDYPHIDSHLDAPDRIRARVAGLSARRRRAVLGENARRLFRLDGGAGPR
ncbi:MAG: amidohydrolase family protein [Myxococcota bacterium]